MKKKGREVGWNYLDTTYTGVSTSALSGNEYFPFITDDKGTAATLNQMEMRSIFCPPKSTQ